MVLALARPSKLSVRKSALILRHELAHIQGADHAEMSPDVLWSRGAPGWTKGLRLKHKNGTVRKVKVK